MNGFVRPPDEPDETVGPPLFEVSSEDFAEGFGETLHETLDLNGWTHGTDLGALFRRTEAQIEQAVAHEDVWRRKIRDEVFPLIKEPAHGGPESAGVYAASTGDLEDVLQNLLFKGAVEACDGTQKVVDTIPLTIYQIGVSLTSYRGNQGSWGHRMFRRDLRVTGGDPTTEMIELLKRRAERGALYRPNHRDGLQELARRGIMAYAERAVLLRRSVARWRMGHGNPAPFELLTGGGSMELMVEGTRVIRELVEQHQRFVYVASEPGDRLLLTIGQALRPLEYAILGTLRDKIDHIVRNGHYRAYGNADAIWDGEGLTPRDWISRFRDVVGSQVIYGVYRATSLAPAQVFYAHVDHAHVAATIAIADSMLEEHRGFPMLIRLADGVCAQVFGADTLSGPVADAYAEAGAPFQYFSERATRRL
jgi:hypothetical protein